MKYKIILQHMKMDQEILMFGNTEIEKNKFYCRESPIFYNNVDTEKLLVSNKISSGKKSFEYFIRYLCNDHKLKPLQIILLKRSPYVRNYDGQTKWMYFLIEDDDLLKKYNTIWDEVSADMKKEFDSEPVYDKNCLKTKIKFYGDEVTDFHDNETPNVDFNYTCLAVISSDSALK